MSDAQGLLAAFQDSRNSELIVNEDGSVFVERGAKLEKLPFKAEAGDVAAFLSFLVGDTETFGPARPYADLSAQDGSRVHVIGPPLVKGGLCLTIRKRPTRRPSLAELARSGCVPVGCASFLKFAIEQKKNMLVIGGTSSGKTTLLNAMAALIPPEERIIVLEDSPELSLPQPHVMYLRTRLRDTSGLADVTIRDLLINTLRMRPDRIIVGECRSVEAADMLQAMNVGHEGVLCTMHANSAREGLQRLETLVMSAGVDLPLRAVRSTITLAIDLVVFMARLADGTRRVAQVTEVTGLEVENITLADLFLLDSRKGAGGQVFALKPTGALPRFYDQLRKQGMEPPLDFFQAEGPAS
jgi:pilus assembly protein CpaF